MSSASEYMGATYFQEFGPRFSACHVPNAACRVVSISIVSISSVLCRVRILRASVSMPCRGHPAYFRIEVDVSTNGYAAQTCFQEFGPIFFDMSSACGYMGAIFFQEFGPRFLTCLQAKR